MTLGKAERAGKNERPRRLRLHVVLHASKYINLAVAANAPFVVTRDNDLLDLMFDASANGLEFRDRFPTLKIVDPATFQATIRSR